jgi:transposase
MARYDLTDLEWEQIAPLLPKTHTGKRGRPSAEHRLVLNGILWIMRSGAPWRDLPERYAPRSTCNDRLRRWQQDGTWERVLQALQAKADQDENVIWVNNALDASSVRAHQHAAGARRPKKRTTSGRTYISVSVLDTPTASNRSQQRGARTQSRGTDEQVSSSGRRRGSPSGGGAHRRSGA